MQAFESPMLEDCSSNSTGQDLALVVGDYDVKYGGMTASPGDAKTKLAFGESKSVKSLGKHPHFDL